MPSFCHEYVIFVEVNILKTLQRLETVIEKGSEKYISLKCQKILKDYKFDCNFLKMFKAHFW